VETLGCVSVIATDKTGTLTTNQMTAVSLAMLEKQGMGYAIVEHAINGTSYEPFGEVQGIGTEEVQISPQGTVSDVIAISFGCNDAELIQSEDGFSIIGEPTEGALLTLAEKLGKEQASPSADRNRRVWNNQWERYATLDFDRKRKSMSSLCRPRDQASSEMHRLLVKGAPNLLLGKCSHVKLRDGQVTELTPALREDFERVISSLSSRPLRCLLLAVKEARSDQFEGALDNVDNFASIESDLTAVAIVGIKDPARLDALKSIELCKQAGIRIVMITGDAHGTAVAIAKELNILSDVPSTELKAYEGRDFFSKAEEEQRSLLSEGNLVFSRTEPTDKQKIVKMLQSLGEVPAMTGDGVNDAPALRQANIGTLSRWPKLMSFDNF